MTKRTDVGPDELEQAELRAAGFKKIYRGIPTEEGKWRRGGHLVRIKVIDLEAALPASVDLGDLQEFAVVSHYDGHWEALPCHLDYCDGYGRWGEPGKVTADTQLCFHAPQEGISSTENWPGGHDYEGNIKLTLWDSRDRAQLEGLEVYYSTQPEDKLAVSANALRLEESEAGFAVTWQDKRLVHFAADKAYQIDWACGVRGNENMVPEGRVWRWLLTETPAELGGSSDDEVAFKPVVRAGPILVVKISGTSLAGQMTATLRIFLQNEALVLEFSDYRTSRTRPELPPEVHERNYAGQQASPYPGVHYAAFMVEMDDPET